jgi:hypothetical protein
VEGPAKALEDHALAMHSPRAPWGVSVHEAMESLTALAERDLPPTTTRRLRGDDLSACSREDLVRWSQTLVEAVDLGAFEVGPWNTPWAGAQLHTDEAAARALARVESLVETRLPSVRALMATVCDAAGLRGASSVAEAAERTELLDGVRTTIGRFGPEVFAQSLGDAAAATATPQWRREHEVRLGVLTRWRVRRAARAMLRPEVTTSDWATLHDWLQQARNQRMRWQRACVRDNPPSVPADLDALVAAVDDVRHELQALAEVLPARSWTELGAESLLEVQLPELTALLRRLAAGAEALTTLPRRSVLLEELTAAGWGGLLEDLEARWSGPGSLHLPSEVEAAWWSGILDTISMTDPLVGAGEAGSLRRARYELQLAAAAGRGLRAAAVRADLDVRAGSRAGDDTVLPVTALSAAGVAALADRVEETDLLVVLGAQATTTAAVLPALSRGRQVLVVGDPALPGPSDVPTAFERQDEPHSAAGSLFADTDGLLPTLALDRQHALLDDGLLRDVPVELAALQEVSLPGPGLDGRAVARTSRRAPGARRGPDALVDLVADRALAALRAHPEESLGVVVPDAAGAALLADAVRRRALAEDLPLTVGREGLLVATPARWSGERRDHVLVVADAVLNGAGLGVAPDPAAGRAQVWMALTRPRLRTTLVLDDSGWSAEQGADVATEARRMLARLALSWEESPPPHDRAGDSALVRALAAACRGLGLPVECGVGTSRRLALVVRDERARAGVGPGLVVEVDDPAWAAVDVLDREVDGPTEFERRGWRYVRVLESDVFADAGAEAERIARLWQDALADTGHDLPWVVDVTDLALGSVVDLPGGHVQVEVHAGDAARDAS